MKEDNNMVTRIIDCEVLAMVFWRLFCELAKMAQTEKYVSFPPDSIEVLGKSKVKFRMEDDLPSLREALRRLGVTMYHLATGESEINQEKYRDVATYAPIADWPLWSVVKKMLSGNCFSLLEIEDEIRPPRFGYLSRLGRGIKLGFFWICKFLAEKTGVAVRRAMEIASQLDYGWTMAVVLISGVVAQYTVWWNYTTWPAKAGLLVFDAIAMVVCALIVAVVILVYVKMMPEIHEDSHDDIIAMVTAIIFASCLWSFTALVFCKDHTILVDKRTNEFAYRMEAWGDETFLTPPGLQMLAPLGNYKLAKGIPTAFDIDSTITASVNRILPVRFKFELKEKTREAYVSILKKYGHERNLLAQAEDEAQNLLVAVNGRAEKEPSDILDVPVSSEILNEVNVGMNDAIIERVRPQVDKILGEIKERLVATEVSRIKLAMVTGNTDDVTSGVQNQSAIMISLSPEYRAAIFKELIDLRKQQLIDKVNASGIMEKKMADELAQLVKGVEAGLSEKFPEWKIQCIVNPSS